MELTPSLGALVSGLEPAAWLPCGTCAAIGNQLFEGHLAVARKCVDQSRVVRQKLMDTAHA